MKVVRPNCRLQFTADDLAFILSVLGTKAGSAEALASLLADEDSRDLILDDEALLRAVLERRDCLRISSRLYFYVLVRQVFRRAGLLDRSVADYVAEMLAEFAQAGRTRCPVPGPGRPTEYLFEMLAALENADEVTRFSLRAHLGNYALYLAGVFPERIRFRTERRGAPGLRYYEEMGRMNYRVAGEHRLARYYDLDGIFHTLADRFQETRRALNDLGERMLHLGDADAGMEAWLRASLAPTD